jgi:hypothetical protein
LKRRLENASLQDGVCAYNIAVRWRRTEAEQATTTGRTALVVSIGRIVRRSRMTVAMLRAVRVNMNAGGMIITRETVCRHGGIGEYQGKGRDKHAGKISEGDKRPRASSDRLAQQRNHKAIAALPACANAMFP